MPCCEVACKATTMWNRGSPAGCHDLERLLSQRLEPGYSLSFMHAGSPPARQWARRRHPQACRRRCGRCGDRSASAVTTAFACPYGSRSMHATGQWRSAICSGPCRSGQLPACVRLPADALHMRTMEIGGGGGRQAGSRKDRQQTRRGTRPRPGPVKYRNHSHFGPFSPGSPHAYRWGLRPE